jgi:mono/diheme cytochrome c family protein
MTTMQRVHGRSIHVLAALLAAHAAVRSDVAAQTTGLFENEVRPFLEAHCVACHGPDEQQAQVGFDRLEGYGIDDGPLWTMVHEKLAAGEMPPKDAPQPTAAERQRILRWIERQARAARDTRGGGVRRLNRRELSAALRDLTGLMVDYAAALPGDGEVAGFDTGADGLQDAAASVGQVMDVTRRAVDGIRFLEPPTGLVLTADLKDAKDTRKAFDPWKAQGAAGKMGRFTLPGAGALVEPQWLGDRGGDEFTVPAPADGRGVLRLRLTVSAVKHFEGVPNPRLWVEVCGQAVDYREITAAPDEPVELTYEVQLDDLPIGSKGAEIILSNRVEVPYAVAGFENEDKTNPEDEIPGGPGLFRPLYDKKLPPPERPVPFVVLHRIEVEPDYVAAWPPAEWQAELGGIGDDPRSAKRLLGLWIERAWRRPVSEAEQERFFALYTKLRQDGLSFDAALRAAFQSVLLSGPFRYLASPADADETMAQHAIASRLSFLLVGAPPDEELRRLAAAGKLRDPGVLDAQVDRLLADPRSDGFFRPFVTQWLEMDQPITVAMNHLSQQDFRFGRNLKDSMREETIAYVAELFRENRPARELVESDWTMMNDVLAMHYGYEDVEGGYLRKVRLRGDDPRGGGLLGHAGIQSMLCWMGENWVIYRGAWTLRHILDDPPPPPPLEVPELIPSDGENSGKTFRELLVQHQADANCAVCHRTMDPLGFAFQNFDLSGRWRDVEHEKYARSELDGKIEWRGVGKTRPVDAAGRLPRGEEFQSYAEFKQQLAGHYMPDVVRGLMKNLVVYATGRKPDVLDMAEIRTIMNDQAPKDYPLRDLLKALIRSRVFLED